MYWVIVRVAAWAQAPPMSWEEDPPVERLLHLFRARANTQSDSDPQRRRSNRMRYFLTVFGSTHWADRVDGRRLPPARSGNVAL